MQPYVQGLVIYLDFEIASLVLSFLCNSHNHFDEHGSTWYSTTLLFAHRNQNKTVSIIDLIKLKIKSIIETFFTLVSTACQGVMPSVKCVYFTSYITTILSHYISLIIQNCIQPVSPLSYFINLLCSCRLCTYHMGPSTDFLTHTGARGMCKAFHHLQNLGLSQCCQAHMGRPDTEDSSLLDSGLDSCMSVVDTPLPSSQSHHTGSRSIITIMYGTQIGHLTKLHIYSSSVYVIAD